MDLPRPMPSEPVEDRALRVLYLGAAMAGPIEQVLSALNDAAVIALDDLIEMKTGVDRPRDREAVQALRALQQQRDAPGSGR
jgi:hypothetical protein